MNTLHFFISGRVQGVGFRRFIARQASLNNLTGWVRNTPDSMVEVFSVGKTNDIIPFLNACRKGPVFAHVVDLHFVEENKPTVQYTGFSILR